MAAGAFLALTLLALRLGPGWGSSVLGGGDAWQSTWNILHVREWLRGVEPLFFSTWLWAPGGCGLWLHTLSLSATLPAALLSLAVGLPAAYNAMVVFALVLAGTATYRLARRLGQAPVAALTAGAAFAFAPQMMGRAMWHLNLLGLGWLVLAAEGFLLAARRPARAAVVPAAASALALVVLVYWDWYLALLGVLLMLALVAFEAAGPAGPRRSAILAVVIGGATCVAAAPYLFAVLRHAPEFHRGHPAGLCCVPLTSLFIPSRIQMAAWVMPDLVARTTQNLAEGASYLGFVPVAATVWAAAHGWGRRLGFALVAGGAALVLSLGPHLRVFDTITAVPLPYLLLERALPFLKTGGCVTRFELLAYLPLALGTGAAAHLLLRRRTIGSRTVLAAGLALLTLEYAPRAAGVEPAPPHGPGSPVAVVAGSRKHDSVLDLGLGSRALARQLSHRHPLVTGYLSRSPLGPQQERRADPVLGPLLAGHPLPLGFEPGAAAYWLRHRWDIAWVLVPTQPTALATADSYGLQRVAQDGEVRLDAVPDLSPPAPSAVELGAADNELVNAGVILEGFYAPETVGVPGARLRGRWAGPVAHLTLPARPGQLQLRLAAPRPGVPQAQLWIGRRSAAHVAVDDQAVLSAEVHSDDLAADGALMLTLRTTPYHPPSSARKLGIFVVEIRQASIADGKR